MSWIRRIYLPAFEWSYKRSKLTMALAAASVVLDHYGLMGFPVHPVSTGRICGVLLLGAGLALVRYF